MSQVFVYLFCNNVNILCHNVSRRFLKNMIPIVNKGFKDINPIECGEEYCATNFRAGPTSRQYYLLHFIFSGSGTFFTAKETYSVNKGEFFIMHPFETVRYHANPDDPWHYCWVGFEKSVNSPALENSSVISLPQAEHIFTAIKNCGQIDSQRELYICGKVFELLSLIEQSQSSNSRPGEYVKKAKQYIDINYRQELDISGIARSLNINRNYFSTIFRQQTGKSPKQYLIDIRLINAAELISNHGYNVNDAAIASGYTDVFNFSKAFKKKYGVAPKFYGS